MRTWSQRLTTPDSSWLLALLAPALILGIVAMHSLLAQAPEADHAEMSAVAMASDHTSVDPGAPTTAPDGGQHGHEGQMPDCGGLMAMCLALLVTAAVFVALRRGLFHRVLWRRPPPTLVRLGTARAAFQQLTPLQRTAVLRC